MGLSLDAITPAAIRLAFIENARNRLRSYFPDKGRFRRELYPRHLEFFEAGASRRARGLIAGNQVGKSTAGSYETSLHLTGQYPGWWIGKRFNHPVKAWAAGLSTSKVRDSVQRELMGQMTRELGEPTDQVIGVGTGMIPADSIIGYRMRQGTADAIDTVHVRHATGGVSTLTFKSYESGIDSFSAEKLHVIWLDEECPKGIWIECLIRTITTGGVVFLTATPLLGMTELMVEAMDLYRVQQPLAMPSTDTYVVMASWDDAPHLTEEAKADLISKIPLYQRDARMRGIPQMGAGAVYPIAESEVIVPPRIIERHWPRCFGLDVGWKRTAAIWLGRDPDTGVTYAYHEYYRAGEEGMTPSVHAAAIMGPGKWIPGVIDPAARGRSQIDGRQLFQMYTDLGLNITAAKNAVEAGVYEVHEALAQGQLKIFSTLTNFREEFRLYRRDEKGKIVKERDHLQDALKYAWVSGRDVMVPKPFEGPPTGFAVRHGGPMGFVR